MLCIARTDSHILVLVTIQSRTLNTGLLVGHPLTGSFGTLIFAPARLNTVRASYARDEFVHALEVSRVAVFD